MKRSGGFVTWPEGFEHEAEDVLMSVFGETGLEVEDLDLAVVEQMAGKNRTLRVIDGDLIYALKKARATATNSWTHGSKHLEAVLAAFGGAPPAKQQQGGYKVFRLSKLFIHTLDDVKEALTDAGIEWRDETDWRKQPTVKVAGAPGSMDHDDITILVPSDGGDIQVYVRDPTW